jgi:flagellar biosynthetic protein FliR
MNPPLTLDLGHLTAGLEVYAWAFLRLSGFLMIAPLFGQSVVPGRIKIVFALVMTMMLAPLAPPTPFIDPFSATAFLTVAQQLLIGIALGFVVQVVFDALLLAGQVVANTMGLGFATLVDPTRGANTVVVGQLFLVLGLLLFLALNGHLVLLSTLAGSFRWLPPGPDGLTAPAFATIVAWGGKMFSAGALIALPAVVGLLLVNLALGVVSRAAPQLNLFAVGFPASMLLGFAMLMLSLPTLQGAFERLLLEAFTSVQQMLGGH